MWELLIVCFLIRSHQLQDNPVQPTATPPPSDHIENTDNLVEKDDNQVTKNKKKKERRKRIKGGNTVQL